jgi:hypothetical protein
MKSRDALRTAGLILGYSLTAGTTAAVISGCSADATPGWVPEFLSAEQASLLKNMASTILPGTNELPGAADVMIDKFMDETMVNYGSPEEKSEFIKGMDAFLEMVAAKNEGNFEKMDDESRMNIIKSELENDSDFMKKVYELTIVGFCTSERGMKEVLVFDPIPGAQKGCIPLEEVGGIWAI